jgi:cobalt-zinc-cadmium efflux system protein
LLSPEPIAARAMLVVAALGLLVNLVSAAILSRSRGESVNVREGGAHVLLDALGSVAALIAGAFALAGAPLADPLLAMLIALLVAYSGWRVLKETTTILLEGVPAHLDVHLLERAILGVDGVVGVHDLHVWRIADRFDVATVHVTLGAEAHGVTVAAAVGERLRREFGLNHVTVQPEARAEDRLLTLAARR